MKLINLFEAMSSVSTVNISPNELDTLQLRTYNRIKDGKVSLDNADERELNIILDLIDLGVLDIDGNIVDIVDNESPTSKEDVIQFDVGDDFDMNSDDFDFEDFDDSDDSDDIVFSVNR